jgi:hypothetical protein
MTELKDSVHKCKAQYVVCSIILCIVALKNFLSRLGYKYKSVCGLALYVG